MVFFCEFTYLWCYDFLEYVVSIIGVWLTVVHQKRGSHHFVLDHTLFHQHNLQLIFMQFAKFTMKMEVQRMISLATVCIVYCTSENYITEADNLIDHYMSL